ncbi:eukaryotic translation initiation factor 4 gamma 2-like isoform X2 [Dysidea avara]|uniref:eukaryotic translation initiation factor 4 gamma 2-like isoform X2 n=1 Tax=Dysidea avara TaxID=196820 RepID=UPI0033319E74
MYAQLCSRLHTYNPNSDINKDKQNTAFIRVLVKKCQEEFDNRAKATAVYDKQDGLTSEEMEQREVNKRKMLGNIKFIGELFKLGMLHESIMHQCVKELLEKKKHQQIVDTTENIECLCNLLKTVGKKLDVEKAQGWMNQYFKRMTQISTNEELPPRYRFMLQDTIDLRSNQWIPRRIADFGPKTIHEIHEESFALQSHSTSRGSPSVPHYFPIRPGPPFVPNQPLAPVGANYMPPPMHRPPAHMGYYTPPPPQPHFVPPPPPHPKPMNHHGGIADEGFLHPPANGKDTLRHKDLALDDQDHPVVSPPPTSVVSNNSTPPQLQKVSGQQSSETVERKQVKKLQPIKRDENVSLRPSTAPMKVGSGKKLQQQQPQPLVKTDQIKETKEQQLTLDSSDDEEPHPLRRPAAGHDMPPPMGAPPMFHGPHPPPPRGFGSSPMDIYHRGSPNQPPPPPGGYYGPAAQPFSSRAPPPSAPPNMYFNQPGVGHMMPPPPPHSNQFPHYQAPPPVSMTMQPPPPRMFGPPGQQPLPMKYVSTKSGKKGGTGASSSSKSSVKDQEKALESIVGKYLTTLDRKTSVAEVSRLDSISGKDLFSVLMTKFLGKSEDDRVHISELMYDLFAQRKEYMKNSFIEALREVLRSINEYQTVYSQCKAYIAGFVARAIAKSMINISDVSPLFVKGQHHPIMLTILQALLILIGEDELVSQFTSSRLQLAAFLPSSIHGHHTIVELLETHYKNLEFLYPLRRIEKELTARLKQEKTAPPIYKWIKTNVDSSFYSTSDFVMVLTTCILEHVSSSTWLREDLSIDQVPSRQALEDEEKLIGTFKVLVQKFVHDSIPLQISAIYATQLFCHKHQFPKGLLLRMFSHWYDLDVIEEDAFLKWKEDISHNFPGKGKALFQVNQWLVWLAEPDEESDEEET